MPGIRTGSNADSGNHDHGRGVDGGVRGMGRGDDDGEGWSDEKYGFSGVHLSSLPICEANSAYVKAQREAFADGDLPPAFAARGEEEEGGGAVKEGGFAGRVSREELTRGGRRAMGLRGYVKEHHNPALEEHHRLLDMSYQW